MSFFLEVIFIIGLFCLIAKAAAYLLDSDLHVAPKYVKHGALVVSGEDSVTVPLRFFPHVYYVAFTDENDCGYPSCNPSPSDFVTAELVEFENGKWGLKVKWKVTGYRTLKWFVKK